MSVHAHREFEVEQDAKPVVRARATKIASIVPLKPPPAIQTAMHPDVFKLAMACWLMLLCEFWITFWVSSNALFMVAIGTCFAVMYFGIPFVMSRIGPGQEAPDVSLAEFVRRPFGTIYGSVSGLEAMLQVILVPLALSGGGLAISLIIHYARQVH